MEDSAVELVLVSTCRCCIAVSENEPFDNIFECIFEGVNLEDILNLLAPISLTIDDGLTQSICNDCKTKAIEAFSFRQTCISTDEVIRAPPELKFEELPDGDSNEFCEEMSMDGVNETEELVECHFCSEAFQSTSELALHVGTCHEQEHENSENVSQDYEVVEEPDAENPAFPTATSSQLTRRVRTSNQRKYECTICGKLFDSPSKVQRHLVVHRDILDPSEIQLRPQKEYKYECDKCGKRVETPSKLQRHMRVHDRYLKLMPTINQHRPHACEHCDVRFWDGTRLERHRIVHSEMFEASKIIYEEGHMFTCAYCLDLVPDYDGMIMHMKQHREVIGDSTEVTCELCKKTYPKMTNLIRHARSHVENATHQCYCCDKKMGMGDDLIDHMLRHDGYKPFVCDYPSCGKSFVKPHKLKQHQMIHGDQDKPFSCSQCDKTFANQEYLKRHVIRHTGQRDHECNLCPAKFAFKSGLNSHMLTHSDVKPFECSICTSRFSKHSSLKAHHKIHTQEKKFACEVCNMRFISSGHLRRHELTHSGLKPFQCQHCDKAYAQSNDLCKHLRSHLGPNIYKCDVEGCNDAFAKFGELKLHKQEHFVTSDMIEVDEVYEEIDYE